MWDIQKIQDIKIVLKCNVQSKFFICFPVHIEDCKDLNCIAIRMAVHKKTTKQVKTLTSKSTS